MENQQKKEKEKLTLVSFLSIVMADIDIFLLQEADQKTDKDKLYTKDEIRAQLVATINKILNLDTFRYIKYIPLHEALTYRLLRDAGFSDRYIKNMQKEIEERQI
jgi:hypothetical protein